MMRRNTLSHTQRLLARGFLILFALRLITPANANVRVSVEPFVWDFGRVTNVTEITHDYLIHNLGDSDLEIMRVDSGCSSCLTVTLEKKKIPPGATGVLRGRLDLRTVRGRISRTISVHCNDPKNPHLVLGLTGVSVPAYQLNPPEINLDLSRGECRAEIEVVPLLPLRGPLTSAECSNTNVLAIVSTRDANRFVLAVRVLESFPHQCIPVRITLRTAESSDWPCVVTLLINNPPDFEVIPASLQLLPVAEPQERILWIKQRGSNPGRLLDVIPPSSQFRCAVEHDSPGPNYRVHLTAWKQDASAGQTNQVVLKMRDRQNKERSIPVAVTVEPLAAHDSYPLQEPPPKVARGVPTVSIDHSKPLENRR